MICSFKDPVLLAYSDFDQIVKEANMSMADYIIDFEQGYSHENKNKNTTWSYPVQIWYLSFLDTLCLDVTDNCL